MNNLATDYTLGLNPCQYQQIQNNIYPYSVPHIILYNPQNVLLTQNIVGVTPNQNIYGEVSIPNIYGDPSNQNLNVSGVAPNPNVYGVAPNPNVYGVAPNVYGVASNVYGVAPNPNVYGVVPNQNVYGVAPNPNVYGVVPNQNVYGVVPNQNVYGVVPNPNVYDVKKNQNQNPNIYEGTNQKSNPNQTIYDVVDNQNVYDLLSKNHTINRGSNNPNKSIDTDDLRKLTEQYSNYNPNIFEYKKDNIDNKNSNPINIENKIVDVKVDKENNGEQLTEPINDECVETPIIEEKTESINGELMTDTIQPSSIPENLINTIRNTMPELINRVLNNRNENRGQIFIETYLQPNSTELLFNVYNRENNDNEDITNELKLTDIRDNTEVLLFSNIDTDEEKCAICETPYMSDTIIRKIKKCNHFCCINCLDKWFEQNDNCPHCKQEIIDDLITETETETENNTVLI